MSFGHPFVVIVTVMLVRRTDAPYRPMDKVSVAKNVSGGRLDIYPQVFGLKDDVTVS
jgi:hypothetical protein